MSSRKIVAAGLLMFVLILAPNLSNASIGKLFSEIAEFIARIINDSPVPRPVPRPDPPIPRSDQDQLSPEVRKKLEKMIERRGFEKPDDMNNMQVLEKIWSERFYPEIQNKWDLKYSERNENYWRNMENICKREQLRRSEAEHFLPNLIGIGLDHTDIDEISEFYDLLFVGMHLDPELSRHDAICLLVLKTSDEMIDLAANSWGEYAPLSTCFKEIRNRYATTKNC